MSVRQMWEYKVEEFSYGGPNTLKQRLNELGALGWELFSVHYTGKSVNFIMKRPLGDEPADGAGVPA